MYWLSFGTDTPPAPHPRHLPTDRGTNPSPAPRVPAASSTRTDICAQLAASTVCIRGLAPCHVPCGGACAPRAWACNICPHAKSPTTCHLPPSTLAPLQAHRGGRHPQRTGDGNDANRCTTWWSTAAVTHVLAQLRHGHASTTHARHLPTDRGTHQRPAPRLPAALSTRTDTCAQLVASPLCIGGSTSCHVPCAGACAPGA